MDDSKSRDIHNAGLSKSAWITHTVKSHPRNLLPDYNRRGRMALTSGTKLGPYEIQSPIGAGGMGEVYLARDPRLDAMSLSKFFLCRSRPT